MSDLTRLERAHKEWHRMVAELVSPPYSGEKEELEAIKPEIDAAAEKFRIEFIKDKDEAISFLSRNRLEVENFFGDLYFKFNTPDVYDCLYGYYERNFPSWPEEKIKQILKRKCNVEKMN